MEHANQSNNEKVKAFLDLDASRFAIKKKLMKEYQLSGREEQRFLKFHGIDRAVKGKAQFPSQGVHSLIMQNIDDKRDRDIAK